MTPGNGGPPRPWWHSRESILMLFGIAICTAEFVAATVLGYPYHIEFFIGGAAFCGVSLTYRGDRK